jgi:hypothetical protein
MLSARSRRDARIPAGRAKKWMLKNLQDIIMLPLTIFFMISSNTILSSSDVSDKPITHSYGSNVLFSIDFRRTIKYENTVDDTQYNYCLKVTCIFIVYMKMYLYFSTI